MTLGSTLPAELRPLIMGGTFGLALTRVVIGGAELFTGYNLYTAVTVVVIILSTQYIFLLPKLDNRVARMSNGFAVEPSNLHWFYVVAEVLKMILLIVLGIIAHQRARSLDVHIDTSPAIVK